MANSSVQAEVRDQCDQVNSSNESSAEEAIAGDVASLVSRLMSDPSSPYYLHYGDNTGMQLISVVLGEDNYATWSRTAMVALSVKNKEWFIDGFIVDLVLKILFTVCGGDIIMWFLLGLSIPFQKSCILA